MTSNLLPNGSGIPSRAAYPAGATLLPAPAGTLMPGERRGGWTFRGNGGPAAVTLGNAANKPSGDFSDGLKPGAFVPEGERVVIVIREWEPRLHTETFVGGLSFPLANDRYPHLASSSALRLSQVECASGSFESVRKAFGEVRNE